MNTPLTLALPKGRLQEPVLKLFARMGIEMDFPERTLITLDKRKELRCFLVKNSDLPTYVNHGIAGLGICGEDGIYESGYSFYRLFTFPFGKTRLCLAGPKTLKDAEIPKKIQVATKYTRFTRDYYHAKGTPVQIIRLNGSVELAPLLGLAPYIVDLVETGSTLEAQDLEIKQVLKEIQVSLIANPGYYKIHYKKINKLVERIEKEV